MSYNLKTLSLMIALVGCVMLPSARANRFNKETMATFSAPVQIPDQVLPPGTYVFKLADNQADRHVVQIFTEDRRELIATVQAIAAYRLNPTEDTMMTFKERLSGSPEAVSRWFYPGELAGLAFVYPEDQSITE